MMILRLNENVGISTNGVRCGLCEDVHLTQIDDLDGDIYSYIDKAQCLGFRSP